MKTESESLLKRLGALLALLLISLAFHYPRLFFIAEMSKQVSGQKSLFVNAPLLCKWDCLHYQYLANGSDFAKDGSVAAFFPLFPLLLKGLHAIAPGAQLDILSVVLSNAFSWMVVALLIVLGGHLWKGSQSLFSRPALLLGFAVAVYPFSQFFSFGYSEPLFLCLYAGALLFWVRGNGPASGLLVGLAAVTRPQGIWGLATFLGLIAYRFYLDTFKREKSEPTRSSWRSAVLTVFLAVIPFVLFLIWQERTFGNPLAFLKAQSNWGRSFDLMSGIKNNIPRYDISRVINLLSLYAAFRFIRRAEPYWKWVGVTTLLMTEIPLFFGGFMSYPRFSAINLGLFIMLVELARERFWLLIALLVFALTRLPVEVMSWLTSSVFIF